METELKHQLQADNEAYFETIVKTYQDNVLNTCYHFLHDKLDAEDVAQDVFIEIFRSIGKYREEAQLSTWIYRIAVNKSLDFIRKKKRKKRFAYMVNLWGGTDDETQLQLSSPENPENDLEQQEQIDILNSAINALPENQKIALTLSKYDGLSNKQIADILDISLSAVESLIHRAKQNLQKRLYNYFKKNV
ncbi:sigma-70 family RNA polymerase sigma factor [candidate division KSB1 bacterium]|nr:sigma-70 family RNA polymerase sigma factor [candidate division KSB1 bacterium]